MSKLLAYTIGGQKIGVDITSWNSVILSGNSAFITIADTGSTPTNYTNISSVDNWNKFGNPAGFTDAQVKDEIYKLIPNTPTTEQFAILENYMNVGVDSISKVNGTIILGSAPVSTTSFTGVTDNNFKITGGTITGNLKISGTTCLITLPTGSISTDKTLFWNPTSCAISAFKLTGGSDNYHYKECTASITNTTTTCKKYLGYTASTFQAGRYQIDWNTELSNTLSTANSCAKFSLDGVTQGINYIIRDAVAGFTSPLSFSRDVTLTAGTHCMEIWFWNSASSTSTVSIGTVRAKRIC